MRMGVREGIAHGSPLYDRIFDAATGCSFVERVHPRLLPPSQPSSQPSDPRKGLHNGPHINQHRFQHKYQYNSRRNPSHVLQSIPQPIPRPQRPRAQAQQRRSARITAQNTPKHILSSRRNHRQRRRPIRHLRPLLTTQSYLHLLPCPKGFRGEEYRGTIHRMFSLSGHRLSPAHVLLSSLNRF